VIAMRENQVINEEDIWKLTKLGAGGQGQAYRLDDFCLKLCRYDYKVGEVIPDDPAN
jgi:hypothetical protein